MSSPRDKKIKNFSSGDWSVFSDPERFSEITKKTEWRDRTEGPRTAAARDAASWHSAQQYHAIF